MKTYQKIDSIFLRDKTRSLKKPPIILNTWAQPEFEFLKDNLWDGYEKLDGNNIRLQWFPDRQQLVILGKDDKAQFAKGVLDTLNKIINPDIFNAVFPAKAKPYEVCVYGEVFGGDVAALDKPDGAKYTEDISFRVIDVMVAGWWLNKDAVSDVATKLGLQASEVVYHGTLVDAIEYVRKGFKSKINPDIEAEGLVLYPVVQLYNKMGERIVTKLKTCDFMRLAALDEIDRRLAAKKKTV